MPAAAPTPTLVIMAKTPRRGAVKTRLTVNGDDQPPPLSAGQALDVHAALLACVIERLGIFVAAGLARGVLALDDLALFQTDPACDTLRQQATTHRITLTEQGTGELGHRLEHVWHAIGRAPVVFFGVDSPDLPPGHLAAALSIAGGGRFTASPIKPTARPGPTSDAAIGPVGDGGYWCLAAARYAPALLRGIDWGSPAVYDQTHAAARNAGLSLTDLPAWHDVDTPADLAALRSRLTDSRHDDPALARLADRLDRVHPAPTP